MTVSRTVLETALVAALDAAAGVSFMVLKQSSPALNYPYGTIQFVSNKRIGEEGVSTDDVEDPDPGSEIKLSRSSTRKFMCSVNVYAKMPLTGEGPEDTADVIAERCCDNLRSQEITADLDAADVTIMDLGAVQNLDSLVKNEFESRAQFDMIVHVAHVVEEFVTSIDTVVVDAPDLGINEIEIAVETA